MKKILIISYYWPPAGGSGVQRWLYFAKYLMEFHYEPIVITVNPQQASYKFIDQSLVNEIKNIRVIYTNSDEPYWLYSKLINKNIRDSIPQGFSGESDPNIFQKTGRFIRGNFFIPDARIGWIKYAVTAAKKLIRDEKIKILITTGPPHSTHLAGIELKKSLDLKWICDFRDPWTEAFYNKMLYRTALAEYFDKKKELKVLQSADLVLTVGPSLKLLLQNKLPPSASAKFHFIYNGYEPQTFKEINKITSTRFKIVHLGILSDNQPITGFLIGLKKFVDKFKMVPQDIQFQLIGSVSPNILKDIHTIMPGLSLIQSPYLPHQEAMQKILNADLLLNSLANTEQANYLISGKLMEYLATGNPILCLGDPDGDAGNILKEHDYASVFDRKNEKDITDFIECIYFNWKNKVPLIKPTAIEKYSRKNSTLQLITLINGID